MQFGKRKGTVQRKLAHDQERPVVANEPRRSFEGVEAQRDPPYRFLRQSHLPTRYCELREVVNDALHYSLTSFASAASLGTAVGLTPNQIE